MRDRRCSRCGLVNKNGCAELLFCSGVAQQHAWEFSSTGEFSIGGEVWPGLSKLIEEASGGRQAHRHAGKQSALRRQQPAAEAAGGDG